MKEISIKCSQKVTYDQYITVTDEEFKILKEHEGSDVHNSIRSDKEAFEIIQSKLDFQDILESEEIFELIKITEE